MNKHLLIITFCGFSGLMAGQTLHQEVYSSPSAVTIRLNEQYKQGKTELFEDFFQSWYEWSQGRDSLNPEPGSAFIDSIFQMIYHPLDYTQYGWKARAMDKGFEYMILPTALPISIKDSLYKNALDSLIFCKYLSRTRNFYSSIEFEGKKIIYDNVHYGSALRLFLEEEDDDKLRFIEKWIKPPFFRNPEYYVTSPRIEGLQMDKRESKVIVHLQLMDTEFFMYLAKTDGVWTQEILPYRIIHD